MKKDRQGGSVNRGKFKIRVTLAKLGIRDPKKEYNMKQNARGNERRNESSQKRR